MSTVNPGSVRERILSDHDRLRELMDRLATSAFEALHDEERRPSLRAVLAHLRGELERHLEYEEATLVPLLASADAWGPIRVEHLVKEHVGQRALLVALTEDAGDGARSLGALVDEIKWFVQGFERDMLDEEATFLNAEALGEDLVVVDQVDG